MTKIDPIQAVIDIGSSRLRVVIGEQTENQPLEIIGCGISNLAPLKHGLISDIGSTAEALHEAIREAERQSGVQVCNVDAAIGGAQVSGVNSDAATAIRHRLIRREDIDQILVRARDLARDDQHVFLHALEQQYIVDEHSHIIDPQGMTADHLEVRLHVLRAERNGAENLRRVIESVGVGVNSLVFSGLASGYGATTPEERELGVCVLDIGAGTTDFIVWEDDTPRFSGSLNIGGELVSSDLATVLSTPRQFAEMLKCQHGTMIHEMVKSEYVDLPSTGFRPSRQISSRELVDVIVTRYNEIFEMLEKALFRAGMRKMSEAGLVLTGGAAQMPGLANYASEAFSMPVRVARPPLLTGLSDHLQHDPGMMTSLGLLKLINQPLPDHVWVNEDKAGIIKRFKSIFSRYL